MKEPEEITQSDQCFCEAIKIGIIVIEKEQLKIKWYNLDAGEILSEGVQLKEGIEQGKNITDITYKFLNDHLSSDPKQLLKKSKSIKEFFSTKGGKCYVIRLESRKDIEEAVISLVDVTDLKVGLEKKIEDERKLQREILNIEEQERWRLGEYLHDNTAQDLLAIKMLLNIIDPELQQLDKKTKEQLKEINRLVINAEKNIRELSHFILPIEVGEDISQGLEKLVNQSKELYNIQCNFTPNSEVGKIKDPGLTSPLYYITQEAIRNAINHGHADGVHVSLSFNNENICLTVEDNGVGYEESKSDKGAGIDIMRHRAKLLGGTLTVNKSPDGGTIVKCAIPIEQTKGKINRPV